MHQSLVLVLNLNSHSQLLHIDFNAIKNLHMYITDGHDKRERIDGNHKYDTEELCKMKSKIVFFIEQKSKIVKEHK